MYTEASSFCRLALRVALAVSAATPAVAGSLTVIHGFPSGTNLGGGIIADKNGTLYGVLADAGGCGNAGCVYSLTPPAQAGAKWGYAKIYQFEPKNIGYGAQGQLTLGPNGELYGVSGYPAYVIYRLAPPAGGTGAWTYTKLGALGAGFIPNASSGLIFSNGALYGISTGGSETCPYVGCGGVFEVARDLNGVWVTSTIAAFDGGSLGGSPSGLVGPDSGGGFYVSNQYRGRVVYLQPFDSGWKATVAALFPSSPALGCLVMGSGGAFYGTAGSFFHGKLFEIQPNAGATQWTVSILAEVSDHQNSPCPEILGSGGSLIGTVGGNPDAYNGDIFQWLPPAVAGSAWTYKILAGIGQSGRTGPNNAVFGWHGNLYAPVNVGYGPPSAIVSYAFPPPPP